MRSSRLQRVLSLAMLFLTPGLSLAWAQTQNARGDGPQSQQESERIWPLVAKAPYAAEGSGPILTSLPTAPAPTPPPSIKSGTTI